MEPAITLSLKEVRLLASCLPAKKKELLGKVYDKETTDDRQANLLQALEQLEKLDRRLNDVISESL